MTLFIVILIAIIGIIIFLFFLQENERVVRLPTFQVFFNEKLGKYLADSRGCALYYYLKDEIGTPSSLPISNCGENCLGIWQIIYEKEMTVSPPLKKKVTGR